jgi:hypothetical protein
LFQPDKFHEPLSSPCFNGSIGTGRWSDCNWFQSLISSAGAKYFIPEENLYHYIRAFTYFEDAIKSPDIQSLLRMSIQWAEVEDLVRNKARV